LLQGWDNIWIEQHHHNHNSNSYTNSSGGMYSSSSMGEDGSSNNISNHNYAHHMNNNNKSIPIRKMPAEYRWFTSSCGTNLPITSTDNSNSTSGSFGRAAALERWSLIDRPPTPEVQEEKQVAKEEEVGSSLMKKDANMEVTSLTDSKFKEEGIKGRSTNDTTATQSTKEVAIKVESNVAAATMATESHHANDKEADTTAEQTMDIDPMDQPKKDEPTDKSSSFQVVAEAENQSNKGQTSKVIIEPRSHHTLSSEQLSGADADLVIEKTASSTLESKTTRKDESNNTISTRCDVSSSSNIQSSSSDAISSSSPTEITSSNGKNSTVNTSSTMMDHPKNSIADKDSSEMTGLATVNKGTAQELESSASVSLPQSKRARLDTNQLPKDDCCADDNTTSSNKNMNANLSKEHDDDQEETNIKPQQLEPTEEEEEMVETVPTSSTAATDGSRTSSSRRSTRKRKATS